MPIVELDELFRLGRWDELDANLPSGPPSPAIRLTVARLHIARGRFAAADELLSAHAAVDSENGRLGCLADLALWRGEPAAARELIRPALDRLDDTGSDCQAARLLAAGARAEADLAALRTGRIGELVRALARRQPASPLVAAYGTLARAELMRAAHPNGGDLAVAAWVDAATAWSRLDCPYQVGYARWRQGEALLGCRGNRRPAARALAEAHGIAVRLGAEPLRERVGTLADRARLDLAAPGRANRQPHPFGLTPREADVLAQLGDGRTNRQIARLLRISESTVNVYVSRVLAKLNVPNRAAAAVAAAAVRRRTSADAGPG